MARSLRSGNNVITPWPSTFMCPPYAREVIPELFAEIESACRDGHSSPFATGTDPGIATDALPVLISSASGSVRSARMQETSMLESTGLLTAPTFLAFGHPLDYAGAN